MKVKYLILGAGPSGLAAALELLKQGEKDFLLLEKESEPGGLCRSSFIDGSPIDRGGGHILDVRNVQAKQLVFSFLPEAEWNIFDRDTRIIAGGYALDYPFEANIWQLPESEQRAYLESIERAGCRRGEPKPERFTDWIRWKLGDRIAETYMLPYNGKIFSCNLDMLGTYWLSKLPDVSYEDTLVSCREHRPHGQLPAHARFYYPKKYGYGEAFLRMGDALGKRLLVDTPVERFNPETLTVNGTLRADRIINTVPWPEIDSLFPSEIRDEIAALCHAGTDIDYRSEPVETTAHWTYYADPSLSYHRIIHRNNIQPGAKGCWTETNALRRLAVTGKEGHYENPYAYPLNTVDKPVRVRKILDYAGSRRIIGLGRWGEWEHFNSDVVLSRGTALAEKLTK